MWKDNIVSHQGKANHNNSEILLQTQKHGSNQKDNKRLARMQGNWNPHVLLVGTQKWSNYCGEQFSVFSHGCYRTQGFHSRCMPQRLKTYGLYKDLHMNVHSGMIHNSQKVGTTHMSINWWLDKHNTEYHAKGYIILPWKGIKCRYYRMDEPWKK